MSRRLALAAALLASAGSPAGAAAASPAATTRPLPVGTDGHGVLARVVRASVIVTFKHPATARYRRIAGRTVEVGCVAIVRTTRAGALVEDIWAGQRLLAPRRRQPLHAFVGERGGKPDYCTVQLLRRHAPRVEIAVVPVSDRGATYLNQRATVRDILNQLLLAGSAGGRPTSPARMQALTHGHVVPLTAAQQPPPMGHVGYWTDGHNEIYLAALTHAAKLFFYDYRISDYVVTTNLLDWLSGQNDP
jgi:hypothetical protein